MSRPFTVTRRGFVAGVSAAAAGFALGIRWADAAPASFAPNPFVQIDADGVVTIVCHRSEMGQGIRSSLHVLIADELGADYTKVRLVQGDGDPRYGDQNTDGSSSIRDFYDAMRTVGAVARTMLITAAAARWRVPAARLVAHDDAVHDPTTKKSLAFGALVGDAARLPVPKTAPLRPAKELAHVGKELPLRDGADYVTGKAMYAADVHVPGMLTAVIAHPPVVFGTASRVDDSRAKAVPGVRHILPLAAAKPPAKSQPLGGVAVVADHTWAALRGRAALSITWDGGGNAAHDSAAYANELLAAVKEPGQSGQKVRGVGDAEKALAAAASRVEAEYVLPYLSHAPMEPPAAVARFDGERCEVWTCTQSPQDARDDVADALGIAKEKVTIHVTFLGGGFGRKSIPDYVVEAALLSRAVKAPVRVQWTREDDLRHDYFHACSVQSLAAGLDAGGNVTAWRHRIAYPSIGSTFDARVDRPTFELDLGITDLPLAIPNVLVETVPAQAHVRIGWLRSVANIQQAFSVQCFIDELSHATKRDPRDMQLRVLGKPRKLTPAEQGVPKLSNYGAPLDKHPIDVARHHRVLEAVTKAAGWDKRSGRALGLAVHRSFLTYVAVVAQVSKGPRGELRVDEAWIAADPGTIVNADRVKAQLEGAFLFGMSAALHGAITVSSGAVVQSNFRDYRLARITEAPRNIHIELIASDGPPGGVGEPGVPPVAPAIANAAFALTGVRQRNLPLVTPGAT